VNKKCATEFPVCFLFSKEYYKKYFGVARYKFGRNIVGVEAEAYLGGGSAAAGDGSLQKPAKWATK
jgi:hypothetical protein